MNIQTLKNYIQSANVSFLLGSGCSRPFLSTLGNVEKLLTELEADTSSEESKVIVKASIYKAYFEAAIYPNLSMEPSTERAKSIGEYKTFLSTWNEIISKRGSRLLAKQVNIYTTNVDTLIENAAENVSVELNDGFKGSVHQYFEESNFQKLVSKTSLHFQNISELPVFNLMKIHGSINWKQGDSNKIANDFTLNAVKEIQDALSKIPATAFVPLSHVKDDKVIPYTYSELKFEAEVNGPSDSTIFKSFLDRYEKLIMVNPTKQKFIETVMDMHFYEMMRLYSNSLERENTLLLVAGFSFADEHIANLTVRAANANPTLQIIIFAYSDDEDESFREKLKMTTSAANNNIRILTPQKLRDSNVTELCYDKIKDINNFGLKELNALFLAINEQIPVRYGEQL